jgi:hypothetical protein
LKEYGVSKDVTIVEGWSNAAHTIEQVKRSLVGKKIGLWVVDGDGQVAINFGIYRPMLADGAIIVCDDYLCEGANVKQLPVQAFVKDTSLPAWFAISACTSGGLGSANSLFLPWCCAGRARPKLSVKN